MEGPSAASRQYATAVGLQARVLRPKNALLEKHAAIDGHDVQHIEGKHCFRCGGSGRYSGWHGTDYCRKCEGSGWWKSPKWIVLGGADARNSCSTSREVSRVKPEPDTTRIEGYVEHADYGDKSVLAFPTLCVLCGEWRLLWAAGSTRAVRAAGLIHGLALQAVVTTVRWKLSDLRRRCRCGRRTWSSSRMICRKCRKEAERSSELILSEQVPF